MLRKLTIGVAGLLVLLVAIYAVLNSICKQNTAPAERILESIENSSRNYYGQVQSGGFNYDTEQSILNTRVLDYQQLTQWAIRPHVKRRFDGILAEAKKALDAQEMELSSQPGEERGRGHGGGRNTEMRENQRRSNEQQ